MLTVDVEEDMLLQASALFPGWQAEFIDGQVVMSPPAGGDTGNRNFLLIELLGPYARKHGLVGFGSSTGFTLPSGDRLSPDAALVKAELWKRLTKQQRRGFVPVIPFVVVELVSESDRARSARRLRAKCEEVWAKAGVP
jgi:Uma2 family endonuclease